MNRTFKYHRRAEQLAILFAGDHESEVIPLGLLERLRELQDGLFSSFRRLLLFHQRIKYLNE